MIRFILALLNLLRLWKRVKPADEQHEQVGGPDAVPPARAPKRRYDADKNEWVNVEHDRFRQ